MAVLASAAAQSASITSAEFVSLPRSYPHQRVVPAIKIAYAMTGLYWRFTITPEDESAQTIGYGSDASPLYLGLPRTYHGTTATLTLYSLAGAGDDNDEAVATATLEIGEA